MISTHDSKSISVEIAELESLLIQNAKDLKARRHLMMLYLTRLPSRWEQFLQRILGEKFYTTKATSRLRFHIMWIIEHAPNSALAKEVSSFVTIEPDTEFYRKCKLQWLELIKQRPTDCRVKENAAGFFRESDVNLAEDLLLQTLELEPGNEFLFEELDYVQAKKIGDHERRLRNRIRYAKRMVAEAPTPRTALIFTKLLEDFEYKLKNLEPTSSGGKAT